MQLKPETEQRKEETKKVDGRKKAASASHRRVIGQHARDCVRSPNASRLFRSSGVAGTMNMRQTRIVNEPATKNK